MRTDFDYIIIGAGSSGCALAGQLAADLPDSSIAIVECGTDMAHMPDILTPSKWPANLMGPADYAYNTVIQPNLDQRWLHYPRGCGLGGSSLINALIYSRGFQEDWDEMPEGWRSTDVTSLFEVIEARLKPSIIKPGIFGAAVSSAAEILGFPTQNTGSWERAGMTNGLKVCVDEATGRRTDIFRAFGADRENVTVVQGVASKLLLESRDGSMFAVGLALQGQRSIQIREHGEIILCAGAIDTPKLLQLSGIGPAELLQKNRIPVIQDLPVGHGLKDHTLLTMAANTSAATDPINHFSSNGIEGFLNDTDSGVQLMIVNGISAPSMIPYVIKTCINKGGLKNKVVRVLLSYIVAPLIKLLVKFGPIRKALVATGAVNICLTSPTSVGTVSIGSANPAEPPLIDPNYLSTDADRDSMKKGVELAQKVFVAKPVARMVTQMTLEPAKAAPLWDFIAKGCSSYWHPTGTCQIGQCLDTSLRVHGIKGLRVADASSLPLHPRVPTQAACMVVGMRCADLIRSESKQ